MGQKTSVNSYAYRKWCYYESHREHALEQHKKYYAEHKEHYKKYREDHRDRFRELKQAWQLSNKDKRRQYHLLRKQKEQRTMLGFSVQDWDVKVSATNGICPNCKCFVGIEKMTMDHIIPLSKAPLYKIYSIDEVQPLCNKCNGAKKAKEGCFS